MRVVVSTLGTFGDVIPLSRLGRALIARGHELAVHAWSMYRPQLDAPGVRFIVRGADVSPEALHHTIERALVQATPRDMVRCFVQRLYLEELAREYEVARAAIAGADVAVINVIDHVGQAAARAVGVPWVGWHSRPLLADARAGAEDRILAPVDAELSARLAQVTGTERAVRVFREGSPRLDLVAASPALVGPGPGITGHWLAPAEDGDDIDLEDITSFCDRGGPVVFVTFGTIPDQGRAATVVAAGRRAGVRLVIQTDAAVAPADDVLVVSRRIPYGAVLRRFDGVVHHGGAGTTHEVCRAGVPSLCVPHFGDQYYWAQLVPERGLGPAHVPHVELAMPDRLVAPIRALVERPAYRERAREIAPVLAAEDGVAVAAARLEAA